MRRFRSHIHLRIDNPATMRKLFINMDLADLENLEMRGAAPKKAGVVSSTCVLIITDGHVDVCLSSLKKLRGIIKRKILINKADLPSHQIINTKYVGIRSPGAENSVSC